MVTITKNDFRLYEITDPHKQNFKPTDNLSDFQSFCLKKVGDAIRGPKSQHYWSDCHYMWYTDETQTNRQCVWMTENGILMFEDIGEKKLYRVLFDR